MVPFFGTCYIAYVPEERVVGLSKLTRLVDCFAQRLQIQERLTQQICDAIVQHLEPAGTLVITKARHLCCLGRGVKRTKMDFMCMSEHGKVYDSLRTILLGDN
jgi:GTP cyclohydrolase I